MKLFKIILLFTFTLIPVNLHAQEKPDPTTTLLQNSLSAFMQKNNIKGAAIQLYVNGKSYEQFDGYTDAEKKDPVIRKTVFEMGDISKIMTTLLFAQEYDWAKLGLNDPVTKYVKGLSASYDKITLQDLALERYSNAGIKLLGEAVANSTESDFADLYRRHVLNPLQMVNGATVPATLTKYYGQGYDRTGNPVAHADGIRASVADMQKFLSAAIGLPGTPPRVLYPMKLTQSMFLKKENGYQGLAWQIHTISNDKDINGLLSVNDHPGQTSMKIEEVYERPVYSDKVLMDKVGATAGFSAYIAVIPGKKSGIVILANKNLPDDVMVRLARSILFKVTNLE